MDLLNIYIARDASKRGVLGAHADDPVVNDSPGLLTRARRALARAHAPVRPIPTETASRPGCLRRGRISTPRP
jgi:hypothetical protein